MSGKINNQSGKRKTPIGSHLNPCPNLMALGPLFGSIYYAIFLLFLSPVIFSEKCADYEGTISIILVIIALICGMGTGFFLDKQCNGMGDNKTNQNHNVREKERTRTFLSN